MALIKKSDLAYEYKWSAREEKDDPRVTGEPDSTLLDRNEGYEMLYFINKLSEKWDFKKKSSGLKIERMVKEHVPSNIRSQEKIMNWVRENWKSYE